MKNPYQSKKNKYGVSPKEQRTYNGIVFDSKAEMKRYKELVLLQSTGNISNLALQPEFVLQEPFIYQGKKYQAIKYKADFSYYEWNVDKYGMKHIFGKTIIEDVKGRKTKEYQIKKKLLLAKYPDINFREVS